MTELAHPGTVNINAPRYDQGTYSGRARHFFITTNPLNVFASGKDLDEAKQIIQDYTSGRDVPGLTVDRLWRAKNLYDSAYHPDTGEKMLLIGRMSAQVPMNMTITGCMLTFYKTTPQVVFWQWANQTFNAIVNYTNRSGSKPISTTTLASSYVLATSGALAVGIGLKSAVSKVPPIFGRFVPFAAVAAANCVNIPMMRGSELQHGIPVFTEDGKEVGQSKHAAQSAIVQVLMSRIAMAVPGMFVPPLIMNSLEKGKFLKKYPMMNAPIQIGLVGLFLAFATPMCCALFPQKSSIAVSHAEDHIKEACAKLDKPIDRVYFNKGL